MRGSIQPRTRQDGSRYYLVRVELAPDPVTGQRRQRSKAFPTKKAAEAALAQWLADIERGTAVEPDKITLGEYLDEWLPAHRTAKNLRLSTVTSYALNIRQHLKPHLGAIPLQRLTPKHVQDFYAALLSHGRQDHRVGGLSARTVHYIAMILKQALQRAVELQLVPRNVAAIAKAPSPPKAEQPSWTAEQARQFLGRLDREYYGPALLLYMTTGCRRGEVLGARWQDLDLEQGILYVRQQLTEVRGKLYLGPPKTRSGQRAVSLLPVAVEALREHQQRQAEHRLALGALWEDRDLVFTTPTGAPLHPRNVYRRYWQLLEASGLPRLSLHGLRHTYASLVYAETRDMLLVSRVLGHADASTTSNIYAHLALGAERQAADAIGRALFTPPDQDHPAPRPSGDGGSREPDVNLEP